ncbi:hypothetical protein GCM10010112_93730 [Actinoplanes lobatus]|uniref:Uncharacterized protein n=1 Tax=Actinoplanes lobatus TaxID=113568 RepID=A0ABQ4AZM0_9ACTN|nr:hypothetical protein GCM10010112_93730 [Actinoplanes lobatus]GIE46419.1 hypothetical protein Alo02nite_93170 [Actinoplanes lobatus]
MAVALDAVHGEGRAHQHAGAARTGDPRKRIGAASPRAKDAGAAGGLVGTARWLPTGAGMNPVSKFRG